MEICAGIPKAAPKILSFKNMNMGNSHITVSELPWGSTKFSVETFVGTESVPAPNSTRMCTAEGLMKWSQVSKAEGENMEGQ